MPGQPRAPAAAADGWQESLVADLVECNSLNLVVRPEGDAKGREMAGPLSREKTEEGLSPATCFLGAYRER